MGENASDQLTLRQGNRIVGPLQKRGRGAYECKEIEHCLSLLGEELEALGVRTTFRLLMIGGGFMLTQVGSRVFTKDVDVLLYDRGTLYYTEDYRRFKSAVRLVAACTNLDASWLSDNISDFLGRAGERRS